MVIVRLYVKQRTQLKGSDIRMMEDFPKVIINQKNAQAPIMFEARRQNMKSFLLAEKLIIENKTYTLNSLHTLPNSLKMSNIGLKKITDNITPFYGSLCWLSNFKYAPFTHGDILYHSTEQFLHHHKAMIFDDPISAAKILSAKTPNECKTLGHQIQHFENERWNKHAKDIMKT